MLRRDNGSFVRRDRDVYQRLRLRAHAPLAEVTPITEPGAILKFADALMRTGPHQTQGNET